MFSEPIIEKQSESSVLSETGNSFFGSLKEESQGWMNKTTPEKESHEASTDVMQMMVWLCI